MHEEAVDLLVHLLLLAAYSAVAGVLTIGGIIIEYQGYLAVVAGQATLALWISVIGFAMFSFAYLVVRDKVAVQLAALRA